MLRLDAIDMDALDAMALGVVDGRVVRKMDIELTERGLIIRHHMRVGMHERPDRRYGGFLVLHDDRP